MSLDHPRIVLLYQSLLGIYGGYFGGGVGLMMTATWGLLAAEQPQKVIANAAHLLSNLSQFVGVVMAPRRSSVFRHIEFLRLSERRILVIIVSPDGDVQNRVIFTQHDYTSAQLLEAIVTHLENPVGMLA